MVEQNSCIELARGSRNNARHFLLPMVYTSTRGLFQRVRLETEKVRSMSVRGLLSLVAVLLVFPEFANAASIRRDIDDYVLFAIEKLNYKRGTIRGGDVGVNQVDPNPNDNTSQLSFGGKVIMPDDGSHVVSDSVRIDERADVWEVFANFNHGPFEVPRSGSPAPIAFTAPIIDDVKKAIRFPSVFDDDPLNAITVSKNTTQTLAPGSYGKVQVQNGAKLILGKGTYNLTQLVTGRNYEIVWTCETILKVAENVQFGVGGTQGGCAALIQVAGDTVAMGKGSTFEGIVHAPDAKCGLGHGNELVGRFVCNTITTDFNTNVTAPVPEPSAILLGAVGALMAGGYVARFKRRDV